MKHASIRCIILFMTTFLIASCSQAATPPPVPLIAQEAQEADAPAATAQPEVTIALVMKTLANPFFAEMERGAREAAQKLGINLVVRTGAKETSIEQQILIIEELIQDNVAAIVISPADTQSLIPVLKKAQSAGIVIVNIDERLNKEASAGLGLNKLPFIGVDNEQGAYQAANYLSKQITGPADAIIIEGISTVGTSQVRKKGALRAFEEHENITVVATQPANWDISLAHEVASALLKEHPKSKLIFCANDIMALGVLQYLQEAGRTDILVAGYDGLEEAREMIRAGRLVVTVDQQPALQGYTGVEYALRALKGEELPLETTIDVRLITQDTVDK